MTKKYKLTDESILFFGVALLFRIKALISFTTATGVDVKAGEKGGFVQLENNLSQNGTSWVSGDANDRYSTEIVLEQMEMLDSKDKSSDTTAQYQPAPAYAPAQPPVQPQRPANAQLGSDGKTWWIPNPASPNGWEIWQ